MTPPKLFISYSWSSPTHEQRVIDLATELVGSGVDVILDKWALKEGHDAIGFMEQMVTRQDINKVAIVTDRVYAEKSDGRAGGVGTETQIISKEVYENQKQEKFVAIVTEKNEDGEPFLPTYYKSRIYIDLAEPGRYSENFEKLLRWIFDKPLYVKPDIGAKPAFLDDGDHVSLGTTAAYKRCVEALKNSKPYAAGALDDYCAAFATNLERFRLSKPDGEFDDAVIKNIEEFLPFRNEVIQVFTTVAQYAPASEHIQRVHRFFEDLIPYMNKPPHITSYNDWGFDNFRFIVRELFLYFIAIFLKHDRLEQAAHFLDQEYYIAGNSDYGRNSVVSFVAIDESMRSLQHRVQRLKLNRTSLRADLLKTRCVGLGIEFMHLMQADFIAFMRAKILEVVCWWPDTLVYLERRGPAFEVFARSVSKRYFDRARRLLGLESVEELAPLLKSYQEGKRQLPRWNFDTLNPAELLGYDKLCTRN